VIGLRNILLTLHSSLGNRVLMRLYIPQSLQGVEELRLDEAGQGNEGAVFTDEAVAPYYE
jgi:hypothetical protein